MSGEYITRMGFGDRLVVEIESVRPLGCSIRLHDREGLDVQTFDVDDVAGPHDAATQLSLATVNFSTRAFAAALRWTADELERLLDERANGGERG